MTYTVSLQAVKVSVGAGAVVVVAAVVVEVAGGSVTAAVVVAAVVVAAVVVAAVVVEDGVLGLLASSELPGVSTGISDLVSSGSLSLPLPQAAREASGRELRVQLMELKPQERAVRSLDELRAHKEVKFIN